MEAIRKNVNKDGICLLCLKRTDPKQRIRIFKHREETEVSKILWKYFFLEVLCVLRVSQRRKTSINFNHKRRIKANKQQKGAFQHTD